MAKTSGGGKTVLYCGSFNPLHIGHLAILQSLCASPEVTRILLVVSPKNPLKDSISKDSASARFAAAQEALLRHPELCGKVVVSDIELNMPAPHYTIRTLDTLSAQTPSEHYALAIGGDQLDDFRRWKDYEKILLKYGLWVYPRKGFDCEKLREELLKENPLYQIRLIEAAEVDVSSTLIREGVLSDEHLM